MIMLCSVFCENFEVIYVLCSYRWIYRTDKELNGTSYAGTFGTYPGAGFYQDLSTTRAKTKAIVEGLKENRWIDRGTRVVFLDFTIYNPNVNLFTVSKYAFTFTGMIYIYLAKIAGISKLKQFIVDVTSLYPKSVNLQFDAMDI